MLGGGWASARVRGPLVSDLPAPGGISSEGLQMSPICPPIPQRPVVRGVLRQVAAPCSDWVSAWGAPCLLLMDSCGESGGLFLCPLPLSK